MTGYQVYLAIATPFAMLTAVLYYAQLLPFIN